MTPNEVDARMESEIGPLWRELRGGLWHATPSHRFRNILKEGQIRHDAPLPDGEYQWAALGTTECRAVGGVSLFDFRDAIWSDHFGRRFPDSLTPFLRRPGSIPTDQWVSTVWLGFDRDRLPGFVSIQEIKALRAPLGSDALKKRWMPGIEACHKGPIPLSVCSRIMVVCTADFGEFQLIECGPADRIGAALDEIEADWRVRFSEYYETRALPQREQLIGLAAAVGAALDENDDAKGDISEAIQEARRRAGLDPK